MSGYEWCSECRCHHGLGQHLPEWLVWCEDEGETADDASWVRASDPESAAERWAEEYDARDYDYTILQGEEPIVSVMRDSGTVEKVLRYRVRGESQPVYTAEEVE